MNLVNIVRRFAGICEEQLVKEKYPEYAEYAKVTKRMIPYLF
jgi:hypothetical protein